MTAGRMVRRLLAILAAAGIPVLALGQVAPARTYTVMWTVIADPGKVLTGKGRYTIWTYRTLLPSGVPPPLPQTLLYRLDVPPECKGQTRCTLATLPLPDPTVLSRVIVSGDEAAPGVGPRAELTAAVTVHKPAGTY